MNATIREIQDGLKAELVEAVGRHRFRLWFRDLAVSDVDGEQVVLDVPSDVHLAWMQVTFGDVLRQACERVLGEGVHVDVRVSSEAARRGALRDRLPQKPGEWEARLAEHRPAPTFEGFVADSANRFALLLLERLATAGANATRGALVVVGPPGSGKTHLLQAAADVRGRRSPGAVALLDAQGLTQRYVSALRARDLDAVRAFELSLGERELVLLDGLEELADRAATQEELVRLLDKSSGDTGPCWVLASRVAPAELGGLSERLRCRRAAGLEARLRAPSDTVLDEILVRRAAAQAQVVPDDVRQAIRRRSTSVPGAVALVDRWALGSRLAGEALDATWLEEVAPGVSLTPSEEVVRRVKQVVAEHFGVEGRWLERPTKLRQAAFPRRVAMYLVYRACALPLGRLGEAFGLRSHSSVSRAVQEVRTLRERDAGVEQMLDGLLARV